MPETIKAMKGKNKVEALSLFARESAKASGVKSKLFADMFEKDALGVPLPSNNIFWSISHKPDFVAGVVSVKKLGIDIEKIKDVSDVVVVLFAVVILTFRGSAFKDELSNRERMGIIYARKV